MTQKLRKILIMVVMAALIICLMAASLTYTFTYGRYAGGKFDNENSPYGDLIEFVGANQYIVRTPEELIQAIKDGYSNIKIADDAEKPFVIDTGVTDVSANLVLDLNGTNVIRNSRNPLLDVKEEVSVVLVYDSSKTAGSFYNPVGSNLQVSGGTLTVAVGDYISGPKDGEYTSDIVSTTTATLVTRESRTSAYGEPASVDYLPQVGGNVYYSTESGGENTEPEGVNKDYIKDDTFLIYTEEQGELVIGKLNGDGDVVLPDSDGYDDLTTPKQIFIQNGDEVEALSVACNVASCDFYYYYDTGDWIGADGNRYTSQSGQSPDEGSTPIYAVIYGYWDVKTLAEGQYDASTEEYKSFYNQADLVWPYAAVRMVESDNAAQDDNAAQGECFARGGQFSNNFDTVNTYGIYAESGSLVASGNVKFSTGGNGVCIRCEGSASLSIDGGTYSSEIGNTIEMSGGKMTVTAGTFKKSGGKGIGSGSGEDQAKQQVANQTAMIDMQGGTLTIKGNSADSVKLTAGSAVTNPDDGTVTYSGTLQNVFGIRAEGGTVTTSGCTFNISGDYSAGVLSYNGTINLDDNTVINVTQSETATVLTSAGVSSEQASGEHPVELSGDVTIDSNGLGITARGTVKVTGGKSTVTTSRGTGIYVNNGSFTVGSEAAITVNSTVQSGCSWATPPGTETTNSPDINIYNGVYVQGGSLVSTGTLKVTFTGVANDAPGSGDNISDLNGFNAYRLFEIKSYAVRVEGSGDTTVKIASGNITNQVGGGVLVNGGTVTLGTTGEGAYNESTKRGLTVQTTGKDVYYTLNGQYINSGIYDAMNGANGADDGDIQSGGNWRYLLPKTGGPAVKVTNGNLSVYGGSYHALQGDGIVINGGTAEIQGGEFLGQDSYYIQNNYHTEGWWPWEETVFDGASVVTSNIKEPQAGPAASYAFKVYNGTADVYGGTFGSSSSIASGAFVMGTSTNSMGSANIYGGTFVVSSGNTGGQAGFSVYEYGNVLVDPKGGEVTMTGLAAGLVIESAPNAASVEIRDGTFSSTRDNGNSDGIWYSNSNATLTISGGTFTGAARSGLYFDANPGNNVELSGGTYYGHSSEQYDGKVMNGNRTWYNNGSIGSTVRSEFDVVYNRVGVGHDLHLNAIIAAGCNVYVNDVQIYAGTNDGSICDTISKHDVVVIK